MWGQNTTAQHDASLETLLEKDNDYELICSSLVYINTLNMCYNTTLATTFQPSQLGFQAAKTFTCSVGKLSITSCSFTWRGFQLFWRKGKAYQYLYRKCNLAGKQQIALQILLCSFSLDCFVFAFACLFLLNHFENHFFSSYCRVFGNGQSFSTCQ